MWRVIGLTAVYVAAIGMLVVAVGCVRTKYGPAIDVSRMFLPAPSNVSTGANAFTLEPGHTWFEITCVGDCVGRWTPRRLTFVDYPEEAELCVAQDEKGPEACVTYGQFKATLGR